MLESQDWRRQSDRRPVDGDCRYPRSPLPRSPKSMSWPKPDAKSSASRYLTERRRPPFQTSSLLTGSTDCRHPFRAHLGAQSAGSRNTWTSTQSGQHPQARRCGEVVREAKERMTPIRIGVNYGSVAPMTQEFVDEMASARRHPVGAAGRMDGSHCARPHQDPGGFRLHESK